jgi:hypothetical protein
VRLGGVIFASLGIIIVVLVANGRWSSVWAAMLGTTGGSGASGSTSTFSGGWGDGYSDNLGANVVGGNSAPL